MLESVEVAHLRRYCQHTSLIRVSPSTTGRSLKGNIYIAPEQIEHAGTGHLVVLTHTHKLKTDTESMQRRTCAVTTDYLRRDEIARQEQQSREVTPFTSRRMASAVHRLKWSSRIRRAQHTQKPVWSFRQAPPPAPNWFAGTHPPGRAQKHVFGLSPQESSKMSKNVFFGVFARFLTASPE